MNINPIKAAAAEAIVSVMMKMMTDMGPGNVQWPVAKSTTSFPAQYNGQ